MSRLRYIVPVALVFVAAIDVLATALCAGADLSRAFVAQTISGGTLPVEIPRGEPTRINLALRFTPDTIDYPNLLQSGDSIDALRLEITKPGRLNLVLTERHYLALKPPIAVGGTYSVRLVMDGEGATVQVSDNEPEIFRFPNLLPDIDMSRFVVGTGFGRQRGFAGNLSDFSMTYQFKSTTRRDALGLIALPLAIVTLIVFAFQLSAGSGGELAGAPPTIPRRNGVQLAAGVVVVALAGAIGYRFMPELGRWVGFLSLGVALAWVLGLDNLRRGG